MVGWAGGGAAVDAAVEADRLAEGGKVEGLDQGQHGQEDQPVDDRFGGECHGTGPWRSWRGGARRQALTDSKIEAGRLYPHRRKRSLKWLRTPVAVKWPMILLSGV